MKHLNNKSSNNEHRSRLLHSLGFEKHNPMQEQLRRKQTSSLLRRQHWTLQQPNILRRQSLNDTRKNSTWGNMLFWTGTKRRRSSMRIRNQIVQFKNDVTVQDIPSHTQYSTRIKRQLWNDTKTIHDNANRNQQEYEAEGWNWNSVIEDDDMYLDIRTGELIHPIWVENDDNMETSPIE